jgi:peroxiredoxin
MVPLGSALPEFALRDVNDVEIRSADLAGAPVLVMFLSNHCPYVRHVEQQLAEVTKEIAGRGVTVVAISSNDPDIKAEDGVDGLREQIGRAGFAFPYLLDGTQDVAKAFRAACTPDFFLYGRDGRLAYRGALDGSRPRSTEPVTGEFLLTAVSRVLAGEPVPEPHQPSMGCSIKWSPGNEPEMFLR